MWSLVKTFRSGHDDWYFGDFFKAFPCWQKMYMTLGCALFRNRADRTVTSKTVETCSAYIRNSTHIKLCDVISWMFSGLPNQSYWTLFGTIILVKYWLVRRFGRPDILISVFYVCINSWAWKKSVLHQTLNTITVTKINESDGKFSLTTPNHFLFHIQWNDEIQIKLTRYIFVLLVPNEQLIWRLTPLI